MQRLITVLIALLLVPAAIAQTASGGSAVQTTTITLTAAQLQHLASSPVQIVAAPGTGSMIFVISSMAQYKPGAAVYAAQGGRLSLYTGNTGNTVGATGAAGFLDQAGSQIRVMGAPSSSDAQASYENQPLMVSNDGNAEWAAGDGTVAITVMYTVVGLQ